MGFGPGVNLSVLSYSGLLAVMQLRRFNGPAKGLVRFHQWGNRIAKKPALF